MGSISSSHSKLTWDDRGSVSVKLEAEWVRCGIQGVKFREIQGVKFRKCHRTKIRKYREHDAGFGFLRIQHPFIGPPVSQMVFGWV
jgi:hypothetical protein